MIEGVVSSHLEIISMHGGDVMHGMKIDDIGFSGFGEAYFSMINPRVVKGWKRHREMTCNFIVPSGEIRVVIFDDRIATFEEVILSPKNYLRLTIPPMVWVGFQGIDIKPSLLLNIANIKHDPAETDTKDINLIAYDWSINK